MLASLVSRLDEERLELHRVLEHLAVGPGELPGSLENGKDVSLEEIETFVESAIEAPLDDVEVESPNSGCGSSGSAGFGRLEMLGQLGQRVGVAPFIGILRSTSLSH